MAPIEPTERAPDRRRGGGAHRLENIEADERFWSEARDVAEGTAEDHRVVVATAERKLATGQAAAAETASKAADAKDRAERLKKGEDVLGGVDKPRTRADFLKAVGFTAADCRFLEFVASVPRTCLRRPSSSTIDLGMIDVTDVICELPYAP
jgi:hypothetical protein